MTEKKHVVDRLNDLKLILGDAMFYLRELEDHPAPEVAKARDALGNGLELLRELKSFIAHEKPDESEIPPSESSVSYVKSEKLKLLEKIEIYPEHNPAKSMKTKEEVQRCIGWNECLEFLEELKSALKKEIENEEAEKT